jgi:GDP-L-fucose synthase
MSTASIYACHAKVPTPETHGFLDEPDPDSDGYGWAKRMAEVQARAYAREYGMRIAIARPYNAYGPRDHFDPDRAHVVPSLIRRVESGEDPLVVWGDGTQTRSFIYVEDLARGLLDLLDRHAAADPINLGGDEEVAIKDLARLVVEACGRSVEIRFDASRPGGHPRRLADTTKARRTIGFSPTVPLRDGLRRTVDWYRRSRGPL